MICRAFPCFALFFSCAFFCYRRSLGMSIVQYVYFYVYSTFSCGCNHQSLKNIFVLSAFRVTDFFRGIFGRLLNIPIDHVFCHLICDDFFLCFYFGLFYSFLAIDFVVVSRILLSVVMKSMSTVLFCEHRQICTLHISANLGVEMTIK